MSVNSSANSPDSGARIRRALSLVIWVFVVFLLVQILVVSVLGSLKQIGWQLAGVDQAVLIFSLSAIIYVLTLAITIIVPARLQLWPGSHGLRKIMGISLPLRLRDVGFAGLAFVVYMLLAFCAMAIVSLLIPSLNLAEQQDVGIKTLSNSYEFVLVLITFVGLAPVAEELLFRGYLFGNLRRILPFSYAAIITSALFGLVHFQWNVSIDVFVLSLVLCYLREHTKRLWPSMLVHMSKNLLAFAILFIFKVQ